ncbi:hypothetical protein [Anatilimnocola floriformis]|uniref:hypothetical protein n=1 Tax=Anatilimnocola floriformis TaxID=2948575 RepID=UPI0020C40546|nr:hypothetical protein [Anatilimnocola floriformis]
MALLATICCATLSAQEQTPKPPLKITPGQVIVPTDRMQRPWGELISVDLATRTGKFRRENTDEVVTFTVMPYAELLHHATLGDLQDFRVGERAIFRLHENEKGEWVWLTYIQDEMNMMNGHKEFYHVDKLDPASGQITVTQGNTDKSYIREAGIVINTDGETRFWKNGEPAKFSDLKIGDQIRTKTHGVGKGKTRIAWEVFADEASLLKFQAEQKAVHTERIQKEGAPGYIDAVEKDALTLTLFNEGEVQAKQLNTGKQVRLAPAGVDKKPTAEPIAATVKSVKQMGRLWKVELTTTAATSTFKPTEVARLWVE